MQFVRHLSLVSVLLAGAWPAVAQQTVGDASVSGRVSDPSGAVVAGATVTARHTQTNVTSTVVSGQDGRFRFSYLRVGPYELSARHAGFAVTTQPLTLGAGSAFEIPIVLAVEGVTATVTVSAEAPVLESARSQIAVTMSEAEVRNLPLNGRNFLDIALLAPAVAPPNINSTQLFAETSAVAGRRPVGRQSAQPVEQLHRGRAVGQRRCGWSERPAVRRRCGRAVPGRDLWRPGRTRARAGRLRERRDAQRHQPAARHGLRLLPRRRAQRGRTHCRARRCRCRSSSTAPASADRSPRIARSTSPTPSSGGSTSRADDHQRRQTSRS